MKKIIISAFILCFGVLSLGAQDMYDALKYAETNYYGTARSIAIGNAVTALGGDAGSITINPAGSSVNCWSQFTFTPGISFAKAENSYSPVGGSDDWTSYSSNNKAFATMPNISLLLNFGNSGKVRNITFGILTNATNIYNDRVSVIGVNSYSSMMGAMACAADGVAYTAYDASNAYSNYSLAWKNVMAYQSYMIGERRNYDDRYLGSTETEDEDGNNSIMGPLNQKFVRSHSGSRTDVVLNLAANIEDKFYFGANLGLPLANYRERLYSYEAPVDKSEFNLSFNDQPTQLVRGYEGYYLDSEISGAYLRIGGIYRFDDLRVGAAIQTPTFNVVNERWGWEAETTFSSFKASSETPEGSYSYYFITPAVYDLGLAYTLGSDGFISADWEYVNNKSMRFHSSSEYGGSWSDNEFDEVNNAISEYAGTTKSFRLGGEWKLTPAFSLRGGYNRKTLKTSSYKDVTKSWSFGVGYSSDGSFYADAALRNTRYPDYWFYPYEDYITDAAGNVLTASPEILIKKNVVDLVFTFGWRF